MFLFLFLFLFEKNIWNLEINLVIFAAPKTMNHMF